MAARKIAVKTYLVKLNAAEGAHLATMVRGGKHSAQRPTKARILLKADVGEAGEGRSDSQIAGA